MGGAAVALGASAVVGVIAGDKADRRARKADKGARGIQREQLAFAREQYDDWAEIYGPIEQNLADYFGSLSTENIISQGLQNQQQEFKKAEVNIRQNIAQRGLEGSGIEASLAQNLDLQNAVSKAQIRQQAPGQVAQQQAGFLAGGNARRGQAVQGVNQGFQAVAGGLQQRAARQGAQSQALFQASGQLLAAGIGNIGGGAGASASSPTTLRA